MDLGTPDDVSPAVLARALAVLAEQIDLPDELGQGLLDDGAFAAEAEAAIARLDPAGARRLFGDLTQAASQVLPEAAVTEALAQAGRSRGDVGHVLLQLADYLPLLIVVAGAKLKISLRAGRHFAADAEVSWKADLPRLRRAIRDQLPPTDPA